MRKKRNREQIIREILQILNTHGSLNKMKLQRKANLGGGQDRKYLPILEEMNIIRIVRTPSKYDMRFNYSISLTQKGQDYFINELGGLSNA